MDGSSVVSTWADAEFWTAASDVGVKLLRTNPVQRAGGIEEREFTPTVDGFFDRIGYTIAPELGTDEQFEELVDNAKKNGAVVGSDLVPTHSGFGPDFWLAARGYKDYPGLYSMVEIPEQHGGCCRRSTISGAANTSRYRMPRSSRSWDSFQASSVSLIPTRKQTSGAAGERWRPLLASMARRGARSMHMSSSRASRSTTGSIRALPRNASISETLQITSLTGAHRYCALTPTPSSGSNHRTLLPWRRYT